MTTKKTPQKQKSPISPQAVYFDLISSETVPQKKIEKKYQGKPADGLFYELAQYSADGIIVLDAKRNIEYYNSAALKILKLSNKVHLFKHPFEKFFARTSRVQLNKLLDTAKKGNSFSSVELNILDKQKNPTPVDLTISPVLRNNKIYRYQLVFRDIVEKKKEEGDSREFEKMRALQHFVAGTAQEIHHPLKGTLDQVQSVLKKYKDRDFEYISFREYREIIDSLETMGNQVRYCYDTTNRMINLNKKRSRAHRAKSDVNPLIRTMIDTIKHQFELTDTMIIFRESKNVKPAAINHLDLEHIVNNIITNAVQSMPGGGRVQLKTFMSRSGDYVVIECRDNGVGIPKETLSRIFEPFFTTKTRGLEKSSGLGLSIVYSIVKSCRGLIDIKSNLRTGTAVTISLPVFKTIRRKTS